MDILWNELAELYDARLRGPRPGATRSADPLRRLRRLAAARLQGERLERLMSYWGSRLRGLKPLDLPTDRPRPSVLSYRADSLEFQVSSQLADGLRDLCRESGVTLHMALLAVFQAVLARHAPLERRGRRRTHRGQDTGSSSKA